MAKKQPKLPYTAKTINKLSKDELAAIGKAELLQHMKEHNALLKSAKKK